MKPGLRLTAIILSVWAFILSGCSDNVKFSRSTANVLAKSPGGVSQPTPPGPGSETPPDIEEPPVEEPPAEEPPAEEPPPVVENPPGEEEPGDGGEEPIPDFQRGQETFTQEASGGKVDILVVVDNSDSMVIDHMEKKFAKKFHNFISDLQGVDYQIGVTTTDIDSGSDREGWNGKLDFLGATNQKILTPSTADGATLFRDTVGRDETMDCRLSQLKDKPCGSNNEQALGALVQAVSRRDSDNHSFFRPDADLAVILATDEDEMSKGEAGATTAADVMAAVKGAWPHKNFWAYGIIIEPGDDACLKKQRKEEFFGQAGEFGTKIAELVTLTQGKTVSICSGDYAHGLKDLRNRVSTGLLLHEVTLAHEPVPGSVKVVLTPMVSIGHKVEGKKVIFDQAPPKGTKIDIEYLYRK